MASLFWRSIRASVACLLVTIFAVPRSLAVQIHVVTPAELQKASLAATQARQQNLQTIRQFLGSDQAKKALNASHISSQRVQDAVAGLSDQELSQLAARAAKAQSDFAAGTISDRDLLLILVGVAALILIIVAVR